MKKSNLLVLAGGLGTRLRSAVSEVPKPLAPIAGKPFLHYLVESWIEQGVAQLTFLLHYQADLIKSFLDQCGNEGLLNRCEIRTLSEPHPLGTGGAIAYAVQQFGLKESFLVCNADTWLGSGIERVLDASAPALSVVRVENSGRYGNVEIQHGRVIAFEEKQDGRGPGWINAGLYHLHADLFHDWSGRSFSLERELFPRLVETGQLKAIPLETDFIDIGIPDDYFRFDNWIKSGKKGVL